MKTKSKVKKLKFKSEKHMKSRGGKVNKTLLFQLIAIIVISMLITCAAGCRTGGTKISPNSSGIVRIITPSNPTPRTRKPPTKLTTPASSKPKETTTNKIAKIIIPRVVLNHKLTPIIPKSKPIPLPEVKVKLMPPPVVDGRNIKLAMNVRPTPKDKDVEKVIEIYAIEEKEKVIIDWSSLWGFYFMVFITGFLGWIIYQIQKDRKCIDGKLEANKASCAKKKAPAKKTKSRRKA